ncbi:MAG: tetratricopeptide repeat protein, partial [Bryobacteraceae bacterium]|nr:tetratricopeptide repeat protein [Bryobacteraceae bacterium]
MRIALPVLLAVLCSSCSAPRQAETLLDEIRLDVSRTEIRTAEQKLKRWEALKVSDSLELWKAAQIKAEIALVRLDGENALKLSGEFVPPALSNSFWAVRNPLIRESALALQQKLSQGAGLLEAAASLASRAGDSSLLAQVEQRRGYRAVLEQKPQEAREHFRRALSLAGTDPVRERVLANLGVVEASSGRWSEAVGHFEASLSRGKGVIASKAMGNLGWCYRSLGDLDNAEQRLRAAVKSASEEGLVADQQTWLLNLGTLEFQRGRMTEAEAYYKQGLAVASPRESAALYNNLALTSLERQELDAAEGYLAKASELKRTSASPTSLLWDRLTRARIMAARGNDAVAASQLLSLIADSKNVPEFQWEAHAALGSLYSRQSRFDSAEVAYRKAIEAMVEAREKLDLGEHRLSFASSQSGLFNSYVDLLMLTGQHERALVIADYSRTRSLNDKYGDVQIPPAPEIKVFQRKRSGTPVLVYWIRETKSWLWCVNA